MTLPGTSTTLTVKFKIASPYTFTSVKLLSYDGTSYNEVSVTEDAVDVDEDGDRVTDYKEATLMNVPTGTDFKITVRAYTFEPDPYRQVFVNQSVSNITITR